MMAASPDQILFEPDLIMTYFQPAAENATDIVSMNILLCLDVVFSIISIFTEKYKI